MDSTLINNIKNLISGLDVSVAVTSPQDFAYEGFDPLDIIKTLHTKAQAQRLSDQDFISDMAVIVTIGLMRGTLSSKSINKTSRAGQTRIQQLRSRYGLVEKVSKDNARAITVPRVVNSFPFLASRINKELSLSRGFSGPFESRNLPLPMQHVAFASQIPYGLADTTSLLADAYMGFSLDMSVTVNRHQVDVGTLTNLYTQQNTYFQAAMNSPIYNREERIRMLIELGLTSQESFTVITNQANRLLQVLGSNEQYPHDYPGYLSSLGITLTQPTTITPEEAIRTAANWQSSSTVEVPTTSAAISSPLNFAEALRSPRGAGRGLRGSLRGKAGT